MDSFLGLCSHLCVAVGRRISIISVLFLLSGPSAGTCCCDLEILLAHNNQMSSWVCLEQPEESVPVFVMNSPGAELNRHGVTLV